MADKQNAGGLPRRHPAWRGEDSQPLATPLPAEAVASVSPAHSLRAVAVRWEEGLRPPPSALRPFGGAPRARNGTSPRELGLRGSALKQQV